MAVLHHATLRPTKIEILAAWVEAQPWALGVAANEIAIAGAYRFDDPAGEVGLETFLLTGADGALLHVPLTYRAAPLPDAEARFLAVAEHSVLGSRWVYDGVVDEVYAQALLATIVDEGQQAAIEFQTDIGLVPWELTTFVRGQRGAVRAPHGAPSEADVPPTSASVVRSGSASLVLLRQIRPGHDVAPAGASTLQGRWPGQPTETLLAWVAAVPS